MTKQPGLDGRHRDKNGRMSKKHGNTLISTLRQTYGAGLLRGGLAMKDWQMFCTTSTSRLSVI